MSQAIAPRLERRDEKLNEQLVPLYDPTRPAVPGQRGSGAGGPRTCWCSKQIADLKYGVVTINEIRAERGLPPVPWGDVPWLPLPVGAHRHAAASGDAHHGTQSTAQTGYAD